MSRDPRSQSFEIDCVTLAKARHLPIIDIRHVDERTSGMGWIPGSVWMPEQSIRDDLSAFTARYGRDTPIALSCLSGRRSGILRDELLGAGFREIWNLTGGLLAWKAEQLPVCRDEMMGDSDVTVPTQPLTPRSFRRTLLSCFVAESVQALPDGSELDEQPHHPMEAVEQAFQQVPSGSATSELERARWVLDHLAAMARENGHGLEAIAKNVDYYWLLAERVDWARTD